MVQSVVGEIMRTTRMLSRAAMAAVGGTISVLVAGLMGCGGSGEPAAMTADLERDLDLATNARRPQTAVVSVLEGGPRHAPSGSERGRRDAVPVSRRQPRPALEAEVQEAAVTTEAEEAPAPAVAATTTVEPTPAPVPEPAPQAPEPVSGPIPHGPSDGSGDAIGTGEVGRGGGGRRGGFGTLIGVIIRGGSAGVDNCEEHDRRRNGRRGGMGGGIITAGPGGWGGPIGANGGTPRTTFPRN